MNALQKIIFTSGHKVHEQLYGAQLTIPGFNVTVPCNHSEIIKDFELMPGGKSPKTYIDCVTFRADLLATGDIPVKGVFCTLSLGDDAGDSIELQFWSGGLQPGGFLYKFMCVDKNYRA